MQCAWLQEMQLLVLYISAVALWRVWTTRDSECLQRYLPFPVPAAALITSSREWSADTSTGSNSLHFCAVLNESMSWSLTSGARTSWEATSRVQSTLVRAAQQHVKGQLQPSCPASHQHVTRCCSRSCCHQLAACCMLVTDSGEFYDKASVDRVIDAHITSGITKAVLHCMFSQQAGAAACA